MNTRVIPLERSTRPVGASKQDREATGTPVSTQRNLTDLGNAERFADDHKHHVRFDHTNQRWLLFDGTRWAPDRDGHVYRLAVETVRGMYTDAAAEPDDDRREKLSKHLSRSENRARLEAMVDLARHQRSLAVTADRYDTNHDRLNCKSGSIDLRTGELHPHDPGDQFTKLAPVEYDPTTVPVRWLQFLDTVLNQDAELIAWIQRALGYTLTGRTTEHAMFMLYGHGRNGKSTFLETVAAILGDYHRSSGMDTFLSRRERSHSEDIAALVGARYVSAVETEDGKQFHEPLVKQATGGDTISARRLYGHQFQFRPTFKLWIGVNHRPVVRGTDDGIWRRIRLVPFTVQIPENEVDPNLPAKLRQEAPAILAWMVEGACSWFDDGLGWCDAVRRGTEEYRTDQDLLGEFLSDTYTSDLTSEIKSSEVYRDYRDWCQENGHHPMAQRRLSNRLKERGLQFERTKKARIVVGLRRV